MRMKGRKKRRRRRTQLESVHTQRSSPGVLTGDGCRLRRRIGVVTSKVFFLQGSKSSSTKWSRSDRAVLNLKYLARN
uniref:Uncharacterized protein n=1 Tax=Utricularia reniformis TaxID=192314 RepID=A0A1Y0B3S3_9LAMI|nr:hypothetical protein AEK19_MT1941 [Utricularia reniformis]ART32105.1 hypothetical protein AEK19_MT1941 [Utricularia reniformis]